MIVLTLRETPLIEASSQGFADMVELLLDHGADINKPNHNGGTALFMADQDDQVEAVRVLLLEREADMQLWSQGVDATDHCCLWSVQSYANAVGYCTYGTL